MPVPEPQGSSRSLSAIRNALLLLGVDAFRQDTFDGGFTIVAVAFERFRRGRLACALAKRRPAAEACAGNRREYPMTASPITASQPAATTDFEQLADALVAGYPAHMPLRAAAFIVTLYGDVVVPRGGSLWIGNVIEACAGVGISETLVRTAVSRLVAAGRLAGLRAGRRSFYSLTAAAHDEFARAADILYAGPQHSDPDEWTVVLAGDAEMRPAVEALAKAGFGLAAAGVALRPGPPPAIAADGSAPVVFRARLDDPTSRASLRSLAASAWDLPALAAEYDAYIAMFEPVAAALRSGPPPAGALALTVRLLLVHGFRRTALRDPQLPAAALPEGWSGHAARRLFGSAYRALSPGADAHVARRFVDGDGPIRVAAGDLHRRLRSLADDDGPEGGDRMP